MGIDVDSVAVSLPTIGADELERRIRESTKIYTWIKFYDSDRGTYVQISKQQAHHIVKRMREYADENGFTYQIPCSMSSNGLVWIG